MESLAVLEEKMVIAGLVHRDFEDQIANFGDVVNTRRPGTYKIRRKTDADSVVAQDATATNVQVPLNQWFYETFVIKDGEASKSFKDLIQIHVVPAMQAIARGADRGLLGQVHQFFGTTASRVGRLGNLTSTNATQYLLEANETLQRNLAPMEDLRLILSPTANTAALQTDLFLHADKRGDGGQAMRTASLGHVLNFDSYVCQNVPSIATGAETATGTVTSAAAAGTTGSQNVTVTGYVVNVGEFANMAGNDQPTYITAETDNATDTSAITLNEALKYAVGASAVLTVYKACDVNGAYAAGYSKGIVVDGWAAGKAPQVGQLIAFGTGGSRHTYTIIESENTGSGEQTIYLDRPLAIALSNNDLAFPGPYGSFNLAFHKNALALVNRPLALPNSRTGVMAANQSHNNISMRVVMQYDSEIEGTRVTLGMLCGFAVLDSRLAVPFLG